VFAAVSSSGRALIGNSYATDLAATVGWAFANTGIEGYSGIAGVPPAPPVKTGVYGVADHDTSSKGVVGHSPTGRGGVFTGKLAQLKLSPSSGDHAPIQWPSRRPVRGP
jgi:hypothetical protein